MENQKKLTDAEILLNVINAVKLTKNGFATKCKYKSAMSIYNILEGRNGISDDMAARNPSCSQKLAITLFKRTRRCFKLAILYCQKNIIQWGGQKDQNQI
jgi:hypothetical protein